MDNTYSYYTKHGFEAYKLSYLEDIQTADYLLTREEISALSNECSNLDFSKRFFIVYETIKEHYISELPISLAETINSDAISKQIMIELLLSALNFLSTNCTEHYHGWNQLYAATKNNPCTSFLLTSQDTYSNDRKKLIQQGDVIQRTNLFYRDQSWKAGAAIDLEQRKSVDLLNETPLLEYIFSHIIYSSNADDYSEILARENDKYSLGTAGHLIAKEGIAFLLFVLTHCRELSMPYTEKNKAGVSRDSLNTLFSDIWNTYKSLKKNDKPGLYLDTFLFLINSESIFHLSYAKKLFHTYSVLYQTHNEYMTYPLQHSLYLAYSIMDCPLNSLQPILLDKYLCPLICYDIAMSEHNVEKINSFASLSIPYIRSTCIKVGQVLREMVDCFNYTLLSVCNVFTSSDEYKNRMNDKVMNKSSTSRQGYKWDSCSVNELLSKMKKLEGNILRYLYDQKICNNTLFSWSILENANDEPKLSPVQGDLFEFLISYTIFHSQTEQEDQDFFDDLYERFGITHYIRYLNQRN